MRAINTGNIYRIYDNTMQTYDNLPARAYLVCFDEREGFYLEGYSDIKIKETIYGNHQAKVDKTLKTFHAFNRSLGVILSGDKGIGKSLFSKMLVSQVIKEGMPALICNTYYPGIGEYLNKIDQEVAILFDEFDKTFAEDKNSSVTPQTEMLTLFDGIAQNKKLFIVTCNKLSGLNDYLVNRPGRFHYHFAFSYPTADEIKIYLQDKLPQSAWGEINKVVAFAHKVDLNYDCLRAIAFELAGGDTFETAIADLNILHIEREKYDLTLYFTDGTSCHHRETYLDMFDNDETSVGMYMDGWSWSYLGITFTPTDNIYDFNRGGMIIPGSQIKIHVDEDLLDDKDDEKNIEMYHTLEQKKPDFLRIKRQLSKDIHYAF